MAMLARTQWQSLAPLIRRSGAARACFPAVSWVWVDGFGGAIWWRSSTGRASSAAATVSLHACTSPVTTISSTTVTRPDSSLVRTVLRDPVHLLAFGLGTGLSPVAPGTVGSLLGVALAWLLHKPFPLIPVVGPRTVAELRSCVEATTIHLTADQRAWLNLEPTPGGARAQERRGD